MSERFRKGIVFGALMLAIAWGMYNFLPRNEPKPQPQITPEQAATLPATARLNTVEKSINVAEMKDKSWGDDPFRAIDKVTGHRTEDDEPHWRLSGIVYNSIKPLAIINGKSVTIGQKVGNATVVEILNKSVTLDRAGTKVTLKLF